MRISKCLIAASLVALTGTAAVAQSVTPAAPATPATGGPVLPTLPTVGAGVTNFALLAPILGGAGIFALGAGGGGATTSTVSTQNN